MYILGINAFHGDSSACLLRDGQLVSAAEEERFRRIKHWAGFPTQAIRYCLEESDIGIADLGHVAVNTNPKANVLKKVIYTLKKRPGLGFLIDRLKNKKQRLAISEELAIAFPGESFIGKYHYIEHHLSHLASAHMASPFEDSVTISVDGFGDFSSGACGVAHGSQIDIDKRVFFPHSLGIFYQALTQFIGFPHYGDEYKVMGLAPYGKPVFLEKMRQIVHLNKDGSYALNLDMFRHHKGAIKYEWNGDAPSVGSLFSERLSELIGYSQRDSREPLTQLHYDIACSTQAMYEEAFFNLLEASHAKYGIDNLTLAGGCAMNSVANGKIYRRSPFKKLYVQAAAGDAGGAIGCAFMVASKMQPLKNRFFMEHAYWGPSFSNEYHENLLNSNNVRLKDAECEIEFVEDEGELCSSTAEAISLGQVIGWFQGRMEWGPRALGNRSILGDPRRADMKDILNLKIKRRESFRPFAPSILREYVSDWFEEEDDVPFMMQVFNIQEGKRAQIPAVTHVDGSGRLQTVHASTNARYHLLITAFKDLTGIPIVLNTSFNENEPVVCRPEEALETFLRTKMDLLVLGNWMVRRSANG
ncbi:hypothetical protein N8Z80_03080 [Litorivicinus sp.]|nr:hypothetical protein [Litorivicinus sp.]MDC1240002.1 hypothetical protein [Litorivicinus sp.]